MRRSCSRGSPVCGRIIGSLRALRLAASGALVTRQDLFVIGLLNYNLFNCRRMFVTHHVISARIYQTTFTYIRFLCYRIMVHGLVLRDPVVGVRGFRARGARRGGPGRGASRRRGSAFGGRTGRRPVRRLRPGALRAGSPRRRTRGGGRAVLPSGLPLLALRGLGALLRWALLLVLCLLLNRKLHRRLLAARRAGRQSGGHDDDGGDHHADGGNRELLSQGHRGFATWLLALPFRGVCRKRGRLVSRLRLERGVRLFPYHKPGCRPMTIFGKEKPPALP